MKVINTDLGESLHDDELTIDDLDTTDLNCPRCHADGNLIEILRLPAPVEESKGWFARQGAGRAKACCVFCGLEFGLTLEET